MFFHTRPVAVVIDFGAVSMRIFIKGGIWRNAEDEVLKAAVMKYGLQAWERVASLLPRKTAKQCKMRWNEWLDPTIKKTDWSRDEEEKLLHLAKVYPNQWRTIAQFVGRTAHQCLEHYERMLDRLANIDTTGGQESDVLKRLDTVVEAKPAKADTVDLDDAEKEMLAEAKARLANSLGKKAKRKARAALLEESRRLSILQKRRELEAAGISDLKRKRNGHDDQVDDLQLRFVPSGRFDVVEEDRNVLKHLNKQNNGSVIVDLPEAKRRKVQADVLSQMKRPADVNRADSAKQAKEAVRSELRLPVPQMEDFELEHLSKIGLSIQQTPLLHARLGSEFSASSSLPAAISTTASPSRFQAGLSLPPPKNVAAHAAVMPAAGKRVRSPELVAFGAPQVQQSCVVEAPFVFNAGYITVCTGNGPIDSAICEEMLRPSRMPVDALAEATLAVRQELLSSDVERCILAELYRHPSRTSVSSSDVRQFLESGNDPISGSLVL